jgi:hypothetical protein
MSQKAYIPVKNLSIVYDDQSGYVYYSRYRVTSSDKNRVSEWSPMYKIQAPRVFALTQDPQLPALIVRDSPLEVTVSKSIEDDHSVINIYWQVPDEISEVEAFDVFVKYDSTWSYLNTQRQGPISVVDYNGVAGTLLEVSVHLPSYPKSPTFISGNLNRQLEIFSTQIT